MDCPTSKTRSNFWLTLHKLAHDLEMEGETDRGRAKILCELLGTLPRPVRSVYLANLTAVAAGVAELLAQHRLTEKKRPKPKPYDTRPHVPSHDPRRALVLLRLELESRAGWVSLT